MGPGAAPDHLPVHPCRRVTHLGRVIKVDSDDAAQVAFDHLRAVTGMDDDAANTHVAAAFELWQRRSRITWTLDLRVLTDARITLASPAGCGRPACGRRGDAAPAAVTRPPPRDQPR